MYFSKAYYNDVVILTWTLTDVDVCHANRKSDLWRVHSLKLPRGGNNFIKYVYSTVLKVQSHYILECMHCMWKHQKNYSFTQHLSVLIYGRGTLGICRVRSKYAGPNYWQQPSTNVCIAYYPACVLRMVRVYVTYMLYTEQFWTCSKLIWPLRIKQCTPNVCQRIWNLHDICLTCL